MWDTVGHKITDVRSLSGEPEEGKIYELFWVGGTQQVKYIKGNWVRLRGSGAWRELRFS